MDERALRVAKRFERPMLLVAALVIPVAIAQQVRFGEPWNTLADVLNWAVWSAFAVEAVVMLAIVPHKTRWLVNHPIEVLVVLFTFPLLLSALQPLRGLRLLRLFGLLRLAPLFRYLFTLEGLRYSAMAALIVFVSGGATFAELETKPLGDGMFWSAMTMTTVGSNITATTPGGRVLSVVVALVGVGFVAHLTGAVAQRFLVGPIERAEQAVSDEVDIAEEELLGEVREIAGRLAHLERNLGRVVRLPKPE